MDNSKVLPPEKIQKEFERNPLKLLEDSNQNIEDENNKPEINRESMKNPQENDNINTTNLNCKNSLINCNPYINSNNNNNFFVNNFNIFLNFEGKIESINNENSFVNKNVDNSPCKENNVYIKENSNFDKPSNYNNIENSIKNKYNKNVNNNKPINISKLLSNLKTCKGSIYAQSLLECIETEQELSSFFNDIIPNICQIMCSEYGNYFFQKLLKKLSLNQRLQIYKIIQPEFLDIATNKWGTHSIQSLMENAQSTVEIYQLNLLISKNMYLLFTDDNAYHIIMKMILDFPEDQRVVLNLYIATNIDKIIINKNGAFCVNKFITNNKNLKLRKLFLDNLKINLRKLIFNKFCCINLLMVLKTFGIEWGSFIIKELQENFIALLDNSVSRLFIIKVLEYLKNINLYFLKELLWPLYRNVDVINYILANKGKKKLLNQLIELSDDEQKVYLYILLKESNW